jgi:hypothetical protein
MSFAITSQLKNLPVSGHSPGEAACPNIGQFIDSDAQRGILPVNRAGERVHLENHHLEGGEGCVRLCRKNDG